MKTLYRHTLLVSIKTTPFNSSINVKFFLQTMLSTKRHWDWTLQSEVKMTNYVTVYIQAAPMTELGIGKAL